MSVGTTVVWQTVVGISRALELRGHDVIYICNPRNGPVIGSLGGRVVAVPAELDLRQFRASLTNQLGRSNPQYLEGTGVPECNEASLPFVGEVYQREKPDLIISSLFKYGVAENLSQESGIPWCYVNPGFYLGMNVPRPFESDYAPDVVGLFKTHLAPPTETAHLVLHATDPDFDFQPERLPHNHRYIGPIIWEDTSQMPDYIHEPGYPWVLATLSEGPQESEELLAGLSVTVLGRRGLRQYLPYRMNRLALKSRTHTVPSRLRNAFPTVRSEASSTIRRTRWSYGSVMKALYFGVPMSYSLG